MPYPYDWDVKVWAQSPPTSEFVDLITDPNTAGRSCVFKFQLNFNDIDWDLHTTAGEARLRNHIEQLVTLAEGAPNTPANVELRLEVDFMADDFIIDPDTNTPVSTNTQVHYSWLFNPDSSDPSWDGLINTLVSLQEQPEQTMRTIHKRKSVL